MNARWICACLVLLGAQTSPLAATPADARTHRNAEGIHTDVRLPGLLLSFAQLRTSGGASELYMLVALRDRDLAEGNVPEPTSTEPVKSKTDVSDSEPDPDPQIDGPTSICLETRFPKRVELWRLHRANDAEDRTLSRVRADLPIDATAIDVADLDGDSIDELLIVRPGQLLGMRSPGDSSEIWTPLVEDSALTVTGLGKRAVSQDSAGGTWLVVQEVGKARFYRAAAGDPEENFLRPFVRLGEAALRTEIGRSGDTLFVSSPELQPAGLPRFATRPAVLADRIRVDRIDAPGSTDEAAEGSPAPMECWGKLPARELPIERFIRVLDGEPVAVLTTMEAGKLNLFGEKRIRVFPLRPDRSRTGHSPMLATETRINVWQAATPHFVDVDRDGGTDLVLAYWKGLKDDRVVLEAYPRNIAGSFGMQPRSTGFDVKDGERGWLHYGDDLTGDGLPDLVLRGGEDLHLYPGRSSWKEIVRKKGVRKMSFGAAACDEDDESLTSVAIGAGADDGEGAGASVETEAGSPEVRIVDLNGDGTGEALIASRSDCGTGRLQLFEFSSGSRP